jgi:predicted  nucleic acid-binding Zn-ribbon protein
MNPDLEKLVRLHQAESEFKRLDSELADVPRLRGELDERLARDRERLEAARNALETSQKNRRQHETEVQDLETKRSKYKGQLMEVKTNKEYTAVLHEIETVEREIRSREDQILEEMERAETLAQEVAGEEEAFRSVEEAARGEAAELDARGARLEDERKRVATERDRVAATVPEEPLQLYQRVAKLRGTGMAEARDGMCQTCHVKLRLQMWVEIRKNEALFQCASCNRILYYEPPPPTVVVDP